MIKSTVGRELDESDWVALMSRQQTSLFYGVVTTGIVCRCGCPARTPLRKNVHLFDSLGPALDAGFRPCKRCQPNTDHPVSRANASTAAVPSLELPCAFKPGDQTAIDARPGAITSMPPPTPDLPGRPTE